MRKMVFCVPFVMLLLTASAARAADAPHSASATTPATTSHGSGSTTSAHPHHRPVLPAKSPLPGTMLIVILGLFFLPAAIVGPMVRYHAQDDVPDASPHDEHGHGVQDAHGHGHGHGHAHGH